MKTQIDRNSRLDEWNPGPNEWERSHFSMTVEELEVHEAIVAMSRLLDGKYVGPIARRALRYAVNALQVNGGKES